MINWKGFVVTIAMVNGMIGGLILVLPILALQGGTILSLLVIVITGSFSYYSCLLCIKHLGRHSDLDKAIMEHFNNSKIMSIFYDILVGTNLLFLLMLYFNLIVTQWQGLIGFENGSVSYYLAAVGNALFLLLLTFVLNYFHFGAQLLGYGVISIFGYCIFLIWLLASAPSGPMEIPEFGTGGVNLAASMGQAFAIQTFFIPVLREIRS
jgi:amino acid permease